jgi:hypothetical protein
MFVFDPKNQPPEVVEMNERMARIGTIKRRLQALTEDLVQDMVGEIVPDIESRRAEFVALHNELRALEGKHPRVYAESEGV